MNRLIILVALIFTTTAQADIDIKGFRLGMTYDQWLNNPNIIDKTMSEYTGDNQPIKCLKARDKTFMDICEPRPVDYAVVTLLDTKMFLRAEFNEDGQVAFLKFSSMRPDACIGWLRDKIYQDYFRAVDYDIGKRCTAESKESKIPPVTMWEKAIRNKFNSRVNFQHNVNPETGREWTNLLMIEHGVRLSGTVAEDLASVYILSNSEYLKKQADYKKRLKELEQKTISDL